MLQTQRLTIVPLTYKQLLSYIKNDGSLEEELNLYLTSREISNELKEALENTILPNVLNKKRDYLFSTLWTIISKKDQKTIGDLCFVGEPNADGEVEIGYGTYEEFQGHGYMTEAVGGMIDWAKSQSKIKAIIASTEKSNIASFSVLMKNNFAKYKETETMFFWKLELKN